jgi:hypothetical protein
VSRVPPVLLDADRRRARAIECGVLAAGLIAGFVTNPDRPLPFDVCAFKYLTGIPCPTCGLTRAVCHALHGHWAESVNLHPAGMLVLAVWIGWLAWSAAEAARGLTVGDTLRARLATPLLVTGAALSVASWIVRLASGTWTQI